MTASAEQQVRTGAGAAAVSLRGLGKTFGDVVAAALIVFSVVPVWLAQRLSGDAESLEAGR
jgi:hypothetical protein